MTMVREHKLDYPKYHLLRCGNKENNKSNCFPKGSMEASTREDTASWEQSQL